MNASIYSMMAACAALLVPAAVNAQNDVVVVEQEEVSVAEVPCNVHYYTTARDNWFVQLGAGINTPMVEKYLPQGDAKYHITAAYNLAFGKWMTPYIGLRLGFQYSNLHWDNWEFNKAKSATANFDLMWDMFNSFGGVNSSRVFSIVPFVGLGGTFNWDFKGFTDIEGRHGLKRNSWTLPVSAGLQLRFRLCRYVDFFAEGRASFYGDNFNNTAYGEPVDVNITAIGGFTFNIGGANFKTYDPCADLAYIANLNNQVNALRGDLAACTAALAAAATTPQEVIVTPDCPETEPMMSTVRFTINSDVVTPEEMVNVYNVAQWMKANPDAQVVISGYADKDTGSSTYNMDLSQRRADAVKSILVNEYGIAASRLTTQAYGSNTQPYSTNNWNRIVIFEQK